MNAKIDVDEVKRRADLLTLASSATELKRAASTGGGEWHGPCAFCGGRDRMIVQPYRQPYPVWMCRNCTNGKFEDAITFARRLWPGLAFPELCERLVGGSLPTTYTRRPAPEPLPAAAPPSAAWQDAARQVLAECQAALWSPKCAGVLKYLRQRGLKDETIQRFGLGYCATGERDKTGRKIADLWVPRGILIPRLAKGAIWCINVRLMPGLPCWCSACKRVIPVPGECPSCKRTVKYQQVKGGTPASIFNADSLEASDLALFVEGEFDCMIGDQEIGDLVPVATLGAAGYRPDLATWGRFFYRKKAVLLAYDLDKPGAGGAATLAELVPNPVLSPLPAGNWKDLNDFYLAGGHLRDWIDEHLAAFDPLPGGPAASMVEAAIALGGVIVTE